MAIRFLTLKEFAERIGVKRATLQRYKLPQEDAVTGTTRGWLPQTVDAWNATRPGRGNRNPGWENSFDPTVIPAKVTPINTKAKTPNAEGIQPERPTDPDAGKPPTPHFTG